MNQFTTCLSDHTNPNTQPNTKKINLKLPNMLKIPRHRQAEVYPENWEACTIYRSLGEVPDPSPQVPPSATKYHGVPPSVLENVKNFGEYLRMTEILIDFAE